MSLTKSLKDLKLLREVHRELRTASAERKNALLEELETRLQVREPEILKANAKDVKKALLEKKTSAFLDRLSLTPARLAGIRESLSQIRALTDPVGEVIERQTLANGLKVRRARAPLGIILVIFESRPNVAIEAFALTFKSGNAVMLRGGKEAKFTLEVFYSIIRESLEAAGFSKNSFAGLTNPDRGLLKTLLTRGDLIDIVIPRGGDALIEFVVKNSRIPIIKNDRGLCHLYLHEDADLEMARSVLKNAKCQRPGVCNSIETLLVHKSIADRALPVLYEELRLQGVEWNCCPKTYALLRSQGDSVKKVRRAGPKTFDTEYLDLKISAKIVASLDEALQHIEKHGSRHSESILTMNETAARRFQAEVDAAAVYWNSTTRFTDGFELGLGGEIGISTQKLHVRGPVGLKELTSLRWIMDGNGQIRN